MPTAADGTATQGAQNADALKQRIGTRLDELAMSATMNIEMDRPFEASELDRSVQKLKRGKASGTDNITTDWVKDLDPDNRTSLLKLLNSCWCKRQWPSQMELARVATLYKKGDPDAREVNRRIINARIAQGRLNVFWREGKISKKWRILMYNAIVGKKLIYGLEVLPMTEVLQKKLDAFYVRGLRRIMGRQSTYIDRSEGNTNKAIIQKVCEVMQGGEGDAYSRINGRKLKEWTARYVIPSSRIRAKAIALLREVLRGYLEKRHRHKR